MRPAFGVFAVILLSVGCMDSPDMQDGSIEVVDSAGVRVVTNAAADRPLELEEVLRFGDVEGDANVLFDRIRTIALAPDGSIWVCDSHETVRHYSQLGQYLGSVGGLGSGPGESPRGYGEVWLADSTVYVFAYTPLLQLFDSDGRLIGARQPRQDPHPFLLPLGPATEGWLFRAVDMPTVAEPMARETWTIMRGPATETGADLIMTLPGPPRVAGQGVGHWSAGSFFDGFPSIAVGGSGSIFYTSPSDYRIDIYSGGGVLESRVQRNVERKPYDSGLPGAIEDAIRAANGTRIHLDEPALRRMIDAALPDSEPEWVPALDLVIAGRDGSFWVRRADSHPRLAQRATATVFGYVPHAWLDAWRADMDFDVYSRDGIYRGTVTVPFDFTPMAVEGNRVYGSMRGEFDVESVVVFELVDPA